MLWPARRAVMGAGRGISERDQRLRCFGCFGAVICVLLAARAGPQTTHSSAERSSSGGGGSGAADDCTCGDEPREPATGDADRPGWATAGLTGNVSECCCSFNDLERTNAELVLPILHRVVATDFFAHFQIDLCTDCRLWHDTPLCVLRDCGVCECEDPPDWAARDGAPDVAQYNGDVSGAAIADAETAAAADCGPEAHIDDKVALTTAKHIRDGWHTRTAAASKHEDGSATAAVVVDLRLNPERHTGYSGKSAEMVWTAIHESNCFQAPATDSAVGSMPHSYVVGKVGLDPGCLLPAEQRVYNRLISGMHSSISLHIAKHYCYQLAGGAPGECQVWGEAKVIAADRVLSHADRLENLYVAFAVMLRAVVRAGHAITAAVPADDPAFADGLAEWRDSLLPEIQRLAEACPRTFDEAALLQTGNTDALIQRLDHLHEIMRCVGCDRCKLWGTLQALGVSTGLRVLMAAEGEPLTLSRQEAVALVHTLERFSKSLDYARGFGQA